MKDYKLEFEVEDKKYSLVFNLNVMQEIQEEYETLQKWGALTDGSSKEVNAKALIFGLTAMINEGIDISNEENGTDEKPMTMKQVGRLVTKMGLTASAEKLNQTIIESTKSEEKNA